MTVRPWMLVMAPLLGGVDDHAAPRARLPPASLPSVTLPAAQVPSFAEEE